MDLNTVLTEVQSWSAEDRLKLIEEVWGGLLIEVQGSEVSEELRNLLDRRIEALEQNPDAVIPWEVVEARALERFQK
jgi:putative addiction module component (TIGR02574 family)